MKVLVTGSRTMPWGEYELMKKVLIEEHATEVIQGGAQGADALATWVCHELGIQCRTFQADWATHGKAAGPMRNQQMIEQKPNLVIAFYEDTGITPGTQDMVNRAISHSVRVRRVTFPAPKPPEEKKP